MMKALPARIDRYPAKMVSRLAVELIEKYAGDADRVLDPFCGSGAILMAAQSKGVAVSGIDLNPYAILLSEVKLSGFCSATAVELLDDIVAACKADDGRFELAWERKDYWFTSATLAKYERLRYQCVLSEVFCSLEGKAILLAIALSARLCSRADPRSPKPFISKTAISLKRGRHLDPYKVVRSLLLELSSLYGVPKRANYHLIQCDLRDKDEISKLVGVHSHIVTSPPYINAQDYFRNFKIELYLLEGVIPFSVENLKSQFIGTERGLSRSVLDGEAALLREGRLPQLRELRKVSSVLACVVHRYLDDMESTLSVFKSCLRSGGRLIMVCGDNLVGGLRLRTWEVLSGMAEDLGFRLFERYGDTIQNRSLPPRRLGHKGLIKEEIVSAFELSCSPHPPG